jgi:hypothetical protein
VTGGFPFARVAVVSDPAAVRQVLVEDQEVYCKSAERRRQPWREQAPRSLSLIDWRRAAPI